jgi:methionyl-tRNA synthetase
MLQAEKQGLSAEQLIKQVYAEHLTDFQGFNIEFDYFSSTHSATNQALVDTIYHNLQQGNDIECRSINFKQLFDPVKHIFYPIVLLKLDVQSGVLPSNMATVVKAVAHTIALPN